MESTILSGTCGEHLIWRLEENTLYIDGTGEMKDVPWGYPRNRYQIKKVIISPGCTRIESNAFEYCETLSSITISDSVELIGRCAFRGSGITEITLPANLRKLGNVAFEDCNQLKHIVIPEGVTCIDGSTFSNCTSLTQVILPDSITEIGGNAFFNCCALKAITLPRNLKRIGRNAFQYCESLTEITIPGSVAKISDNAFCCCKLLRDIHIQPGVRHIGESAFAFCTHLKHITLPDSIRVIEDYAFSRTLGLNGLTLKGPVQQLSRNAFAGIPGPMDLLIPYSMVKPCREAFAEVPFVRCIDISEPDEGWEWLVRNPSSLCSEYGWCGDNLQWYLIKETSASYYKEGKLYICGNGPMYEDAWRVYLPEEYPQGPKIRNLIITPGCSEISDRAFECIDAYQSYRSEVDWRQESGCWGYYEEKCHSLELVDIPHTVTRIGLSAFEGCCMIKHIDIPGSVVEIADRAFKHCDDLQEIHIADGVKKIGAEAFAYCRLSSITIPDSVIEIGEDAFAGIPHIVYHGPAQSENNWGAKSRN